MKQSSRFALALTITLALAPVAIAAPITAGSDDKALAETLFFAGRGLMEAGRYEEACAKFAESYRLDPTGGTLLNLAVCHEKTGKIASAWGEYRTAAADAKKAGRTDRVEFAEGQIQLLEPELPYLLIAVPSTARPKGLEILRNGRGLAEPAWNTELPVDPGTVEIVARAPGYKEKKLTITIQKKEHKSITLPLPDPLPVEAPKVRVVETGWSTTRSIGASLFLVGLASAGGSAYFALLAAESKRRSDEECPVYDGDRRCKSAGVSAMETANQRAWLANGGAALAVVGLGLGTYLFVVGGPSHEPTKVGAVRVDFAATPLGVSGLFSTTF